MEELILEVIISEKHHVLQNSFIVKRLMKQINLLKSLVLSGYGWKQFFVFWVFFFAITVHIFNQKIVLELVKSMQKGEKARLNVEKNHIPSCWIIQKLYYPIMSKLITNWSKNPVSAGISSATLLLSPSCTLQ